jgi:hypothetical protein
MKNISYTEKRILLNKLHSTQSYIGILRVKTERRDRVVNTPASYSVGPGFISWPGILLL